MKQRFFDRDILILVACFVVSRIILSLFDVHMNEDSIYVYWQYLSVDSLQNNLLNGVWYNHTQPPVFNLFLGVVLKLFGANADTAFPIIFKLITIINVLLLYKSIKLLVTHSKVPLIVAMLYLLSPATMILENELFYTTFITMLMLVSCYCLLRFGKKQNYWLALGFLLPLAIACLTRSMYNIAWLVVIAAVAIAYYRRAALKMLSIVSLGCILLTASWYLKNYVVFEKFTTSTWLGMNLARNVFHDHLLGDSSRIESIEPFSKISTYRPFISGDLEKKYAGLNDAELLSEFKNGRHINEHHISYMEVSDKYAQASTAYMKQHPIAYLKNVSQSCIIFFAPATRYPFAEAEAKKISWYDVVYSFNLSHFAEGKSERRWAMVLSAVPKLLMYAAVFGFVLIEAKRKKNISFLNLFIILTFAYVFFVSSSMEHYENMRFRFEIEPLFLLLLAQAAAKKLTRQKNIDQEGSANLEHSKS